MSDERRPGLDPFRFIAVGLVPESEGEVTIISDTNVYAETEEEARAKVRRFFERDWHWQQAKNPREVLLPWHPSQRTM